MTTLATPQREAAGAGLVARAVHRRGTDRGGQALDALFAFAFRDLVYAQIWEDPVVDMEGLAIRPGHRVVTIASGGCNALSYLVADPARIDAVDLNPAHIALNRLKIAAARELPGYTLLRRFLADADSPANIRAYERFLQPHLDPATRRYWEGRDRLGRRRITRFARGLYRYGLLGRFIGAAHLVARLHGRDMRRLLAEPEAMARRAIFEREIAPLFDGALMRTLLSHPAALFGLGIPPAQFEELNGHGRQAMADVVRSRLRRLACDFDPSENYFAWQAFARGYARHENAPLPPYLQAAHYEVVKARADRIAVHQQSLTDYLAGQPPASVDRFVLLDAQDWMEPATLDALWQQINRTARPGARVIFRTAGEATILPGRIGDELLARWHYHEARSRELHRRDRSAIYGGFHLYGLEDAL